jgi:tetratricopeptide (TPR) repeat protein
MMKEKLQSSLRKDKEKVDLETNNKILKIQQFIYNNSKMISYVSVAVIVIVALIFIVKNTMQKNTEEGTQKVMVALNRILPYYESQDYTKALFGDSSRVIRSEQVIGLVDIVDEYENYKQGMLAALYAGNAYLALNKHEDAAEYFEIASDSPSKIVIEGAYAGLAACMELQGDNRKAADYYLKASELAITETTKARYSYFAALNLEKSNKKNEAENIYREIINKNKYSEFANYSKSGLVRLGMEID